MAYDIAGQSANVLQASDEIVPEMGMKLPWTPFYVQMICPSFYLMLESSSNNELANFQD